MARRIERLFIPGPAGRLEALLEEPEGGAPGAVALVCHPHPLHGGTMHNKAAYRLARGLRRAGAVTLRFNFRGVHLSEGDYGHGRGEVEDAGAAAGWLKARYPGLPVVVSGFSFGARVAAQCWEGARRVILVGFPTIYGEFGALVRCPVMRVFIQSTNDEFGPREILQQVYDRLWGPKKLVWVEAGDHFFRGALEALEDAAESEGRQTVAGG